MNKSPLVSIIINNYNYGRFLTDAIDSAINQTYSNIEVVVVDDGSTDESVVIIDEYKDRVKALIKKNGGQASAFNAGFNISQGEIIVFLDSDDMLLPTAIKNAVELFDESDVAKVHWPLSRVDEFGRITGEIIPVKPLPHGNLMELLILKGPSYFDGNHYGNSPTSGNAFSRQFLNSVLPMSESEYKNGGADNHLSLLAIVFGKIQRLKEPLSFYRVHGKNYTLKPLQLYMNAFFCCFEHSCQTLKQYFFNKGISVDTTAWPRDSWYHKIYTAIQEINGIIPPSVSFILVDENQWMTNDIIEGRLRLPFLEKNGQYWGAPENDQKAIMEIERQKKNGATSIVFAWTAFWWLDYYSGMNDYLKTNYECLLSNDCLIIFSLMNGLGKTAFL